MIKNIPIVLNFDTQKLIGRARIEGGKIFFEISSDDIVREFERMIEVEQIKAFSLGAVYIAAEPKELRDQPSP